MRKLYLSSHLLFYMLPSSLRCVFRADMLLKITNKPYLLVSAATTGTNKGAREKACWHFKTFPVTSRRIMAAGNILPWGLMIISPYVPATVTVINCYTKLVRSLCAVQWPPDTSAMTQRDFYRAQSSAGGHLGRGGGAELSQIGPFP